MNIKTLIEILNKFPPETEVEIGIDGYALPVNPDIGIKFVDTCGDGTFFDRVPRAADEDDFSKILVIEQSID